MFEEEPEEEEKEADEVEEIVVEPKTATKKKMKDPFDFVEDMCKNIMS